MADTLKHVEEKLCKLEGMMKTPEGKRLSIVRAERLRIYGRWWLEEMRMVGLAGEGEMEWTQGKSPWETQSTPETDDTPPKEAAQTATDSNEPNEPVLGKPSSSGDAHPQASVSNMDGTAVEVAIDDPGRQLMEAIIVST